MSSIKKMREICQQRKKNKKGDLVLSGHWYNVLLTRKISIYFTWLFVKLGISANQVSVLMIITGLAGIIMCIPHLIWMNFVGAILMYMFLVLDCSDGEVARWTGKRSIKGIWLDLIAHVFYNHLAKAMPGLHLYFWFNDTTYLYIAFFSYAFSLSEHSIRKCQIQLNIDKTLIIKNNRNLLIDRLYRVIGSLLRQLRDIVILETVIFASLILLYAGLDQSIIWVVWLIPIIGLIDMVNTIFYIYFNELPDVSHIRKVE
ncbi:MAG: CDP-alcohol phosphatidyltransferase family protein [Bacteroidetes bacterium]|nr:CDP-alcohol phosphatidyltransferase family protein [Bacteroidota bacterium]